MCVIDFDKLATDGHWSNLSKETIRNNPDLRQAQELLLPVLEKLPVRTEFAMLNDIFGIALCFKVDEHHVGVSESVSVKQAMRFIRCRGTDTANWLRKKMDPTIAVGYSKDACVAWDGVILFVPLDIAADLFSDPVESLHEEVMRIWQFIRCGRDEGGQE